MTAFLLKKTFSYSKCVCYSSLKVFQCVATKFIIEVEENFQENKTFDAHSTAVLAP